MLNKKEKTSLFERKEFHGVDYAQNEYDKECIIFKIRLICLGLSLFPTIAIMLSSVIDESGFFNVLLTILAFTGWIGTIAANPLLTLSTVFKFGKIGYCLIPFVFLDLLGFVFGLALGVMAFICLPAIFCAIGIWQSYLNKKESRQYLEIFNAGVQEDKE